MTMSVWPNPCPFSFADSAGSNWKSRNPYKLLFRLMHSALSSCSLQWSATISWMNLLCRWICSHLYFWAVKLLNAFGVKLVKEKTYCMTETMQAVSILWDIQLRTQDHILFHPMLESLKLCLIFRELFYWNNHQLRTQDHSLFFYPMQGFIKLWLIFRELFY